MQVMLVGAKSGKGKFMCSGNACFQRGKVMEGKIEAMKVCLFVPPRLICYLWLEIHPKNWPVVSPLGSALLPSQQEHASAGHSLDSACLTTGRHLEPLWVTLMCPHLPALGRGRPMPAEIQSELQPGKY